MISSLKTALGLGNSAWVALVGSGGKTRTASDRGGWFTPPSLKSASLA